MYIWFLITVVNFNNYQNQMTKPSLNYILHLTQQRFYCPTLFSDICKKSGSSAGLSSAEGQCSEIGAFTAFQQWSFVLKASAALIFGLTKNDRNFSSCFSHSHFFIRTSGLPIFCFLVIERTLSIHLVFCRLPFRRLLHSNNDKY